MNKFALILITSFTISTCHPVGELDITSIPSETFQDGILPYLKPKDISSVRLTSRNLKNQADEYLNHNIVDQKKLNKGLWETLRHEDDILTAEYLTQIGANVNSYDMYSSFESYANDKKEKITKFLLDHGKSFEFYEFYKIVEEATPEIVSQFLEVIRKNGNDIASYLNNESITHDYPYLKNYFPIIRAAGYGNYPVVKLLLEHKASPNVAGEIMNSEENGSPLEAALFQLELSHRTLRSYYHNNYQVNRIEMLFDSHKKFEYDYSCEMIKEYKTKVARLKHTADLLYEVSNNEVRAKVEKDKRYYPNYFSSCSII